MKSTFEDDDDSDNSNNEEFKTPEESGSISLRSMLLRHQLEQEVRFMKCEQFTNSYYLTTTSHSDPSNYQKSLERLLRNTPHQNISNPALIREDPPVHEKIERLRKKVRYKYHVPFFYTAYKIYYSNLFHGVITFILLFNIFTSVYMLSADEEKNALTFQVFRNLEFCFTMIYWCEAFLKVAAKRSSILRDTTFMIDLIFLIITSIPSGFLVLIFVELNKNIESLEPYLAITEIMCSLRSFRLITRTKALRKTLATMQKPIIDLICYSIFIFVFIYIFTIFAMNIFYSYTTSKDPDLEFNYKYSTFGEALVTVFQILTFDNWLLMYEDIIKVYYKWPTVIFFIVWLWVGAFVLGNIYIAVLVDSLKHVSENAKELEKNENKAKKAVRERQKYAKSGKNADKFSAKRQLEGVDIAKKVRQIYMQFDDFESGRENKTIEANKEEIIRLLNHMGENFETKCENDDLFEYFKVLCQLSDNIVEMEQLDLIAAQAIHNCLEKK
ncbi:hypothetical protein TRFO_16618 [Tritrichomonas foetus]|uniref:Ion transport domain-containing protein n=1 Tax=Tritrichomonas foetus TaxID=1144522 RepID=A0A1J4KPX3_9EUKA|nr:hypothetical protein TRFO_16618 [Tritrichomonas foetus]|eukprot:OHT13291.1 hypothetical protein TRFO_16618 [Tritrichomonas foetus]